MITAPAFAQVSEWLRQRQDIISFTYVIRLSIPDDVAARSEGYQHLLALCAE